MSEKPRLMSTTQTARLLGVSRITIFRWIKNGGLLGHKIGRNYVISYEEFLKQYEKINSTAIL